MLPRPRGRLRWEGRVSRQAQREIVHAGDPGRLAELMAEGETDLSARARRLREAGKIEAVAEHALPVTNLEWIQLLWEEGNSAGQPS